MTPLEAVIVLIVILSPILPPIIGTICGNLWDAFHSPRESVARVRSRSVVPERSTGAKGVG